MYPFRFYAEGVRVILSDSASPHMYNFHQPKQVLGCQLSEATVRLRSRSIPYGVRLFGRPVRLRRGVILSGVRFAHEVECICHGYAQGDAYRRRDTHLKAQKSGNETIRFRCRFILTLSRRDMPCALLRCSPVPSRRRSYGYCPFPAHTRGWRFPAPSSRFVPPATPSCLFY